jgi:hypothetical protein
MKKLIFISSVCYCFFPLWFRFWLWIWGAFLVSFDLSLHWHHFFGAFLGTCPWSSLPLVHRARCARHCLFSISPLQLGLVFPAWKLCAPADFLLVSPQARAPVDGRSRSVLLQVTVRSKYRSSPADFSVRRCNWSCLHQFCSRLRMCSCFGLVERLLCLFSWTSLVTESSRWDRHQLCSVLPMFVSLLLDCVCGCLQVDTGVIL